MKRDGRDASRREEGGRMEDTLARSDNETSRDLVKLTYFFPSPPLASESFLNSLNTPSKLLWCTCSLSSKGSRCGEFFEPRDVLCILCLALASEVA
jgi:hypothetical protein